MNRFCLLLLFVLAVLLAVAQTGYVQKGDKLMRSSRFEKAASMYKKAVDKDANDIAALEKLANAFTMLQDFTSAEAIYKVLIANPQAKPVCKFYYAQLLRINGKYTEADAAYQSFAAAAPTDQRATEFKNFEEDVLPLAKDSKIYELNILPDNSAGSEIGPSYNNGRLVFASDRGNTSGYFDLYQQQSAAAGETVTPEKIKGKINKRLNDGPATFSRDGKEMIFTRTNYKKKGPDGVRKLGLYHADFDAKKNKWVNIKPLPLNNDSFNVTHPSLSKDGSKLYFSSDRPGSLGETDIFVSTKSETGWSAPVNAGSEVNTPGSEMFPFIADDGTLYFSSDSRVGLGGLDIYSATSTGTGWGNVQNLGATANSAADDFGYVTDETSRNGFLVSNRTGGVGGDDIYKFRRIAEPVKGMVVNAKTRTATDSVIVSLISKAGGMKRVRTNAKGEFVFNLIPGTSYKLEATKDGFTKYSGTITANPTGNDRKVIALEPRGGIDLIVDVSQKDGGQLEGATAFLINKNTGEVIEQKSDANGMVKFDLYPEQEYDLKVVKKLNGQDGVYDKFIKTISTMGFTPSTPINEKVQLTFYNSSIIFDLPNVYFEYGSNKIRPAAAADLDKVVKAMKAFPDIQVELSAHTDSRGDGTYNMVLSAERASACVDYLFTHGVDKTHLIAIGYGEEKIRNKCVDYVPCTDSEHSVSRRTEFKVVKFD